MRRSVASCALLGLLFAAPGAQAQQWQDTSSVIINELRFTARCNGPTYIELYNRGRKSQSLNAWSVAQWKDGRLQDAVTVSSPFLNIAPGRFIVLTQDKRRLLAEFPDMDSTRVQQLNLPAMRGKQVQLVLLDGGPVIRQVFAYDSASYRGDSCFAIERRDPLDSTSRRRNWQLNRLGTPLKPNVLLPDPPTPQPPTPAEQGLWLEAEVLFLKQAGPRPGFLIKYNLPHAGQLSVKLYNSGGYLLADADKWLDSQGQLLIELPEQHRLTCGLALFAELKSSNGSLQRWQWPVAVVAE